MICGGFNHVPFKGIAAEGEVVSLGVGYYYPLQHAGEFILAQSYCLVINLKKLADAWQPLYASLDDNQKARLRFLAVYVLREMRDAVESRRMQSEDESYDDYEE